MTLRFRLLAAFAYVLLLVLVVLGVPLALNVASRVDAEVEAEAADAAHLIAASVSGRLDDTAVLQTVVDRAARDVGGRVIVVDAGGLLVADSAGESLRGDSYASRPEIRTALVEGRAAQGRRDSETLAQELLVTAVPIVEAGERTGAVRVSQSVAAVDAKVRRDVLALAAIAAAALAVGLVLAWFLAGSLARPLRALAGTARRLAADDHEARAEVAGSAEQRELAVAFNDMTDRLTRVLDAQRQFVANASHQLRTPLTGLRLRLEAAAAKADDPALAYELAAAERETERLARLLAGLLTLAREGADRPRLTAPLSLTDAAERALERWQQQADHERHPLVLDTHGPATAWITDEDAAILLDNLIENALKYTPPGGTITVGTRSDARSALLVVLDEGPGIEPDEAERVFERFGRGSAAAGVQGTGLGLTIVRTLAQRWGGDATIGNRPEGGARVEVELPAERLPTPNPPLGEALPAGP